MSTLLRTFGFGVVAWLLAGCTLSQGVRRLSFTPPDVVRETVPPGTVIQRRNFPLPYLSRVKLGYYFDDSLVAHLNRELRAAGVDHVVVQALVSHRFELGGIPWYLVDTSGFRAVVRLRDVTTGVVFEREFVATCAGRPREVWRPDDADWLIPQQRIDAVARRNSAPGDRSGNSVTDLTAANLVNIVGIWTRAFVEELRRERDQSGGAVPRNLPMTSAR